MSGVSELSGDPVDSVGEGGVEKGSCEMGAVEIAESEMVGKGMPETGAVASGSSEEMEKDASERASVGTGAVEIANVGTGASRGGARSVMPGAHRVKVARMNTILVCKSGDQCIVMPGRFGK
jgi:hypothetical protein